jgi:excisionase family DNA binding protein
MSEFFTVGELAHRARVSPGFIRKCIVVGKLPAIVFGQRYRIPRADGERFLNVGLPRARRSLAQVRLAHSREDAAEHGLAHLK